jgi:hypothetical protein
MTCGFDRYRAKQVSTGFKTRGEIIGGRFHRTTETSKWLRWQRLGDQLRSFYSHDGEKWHASANSKHRAFI